MKSAIYYVNLKMTASPGIALEAIIQQAQQEAFRAGAEAMREECADWVSANYELHTGHEAAGYLRAYALPEMPTATQGDCEHNWVTVNNQHVVNCTYCNKCGKLSHD